MTDTISDWEINSGNDEQISYVRLGWLGQVEWMIQYCNSVENIGRLLD